MTTTSETSREALEAVQLTAGDLRDRLYAHLLARPAGATDDEVEAELGTLGGAVRADTWRKRRGELAAAGLAVESGSTRTTRSGRQAVVWIVADPVRGREQAEALGVPFPLERAAEPPAQEAPTMTSGHNPTVLIVDGKNALYRAFYAAKGGASPAVGYQTWLAELRDTYEPAALIVAWDADGPTWRHLEFESYKAQREPPPDGLVTLCGGAAVLTRDVEGATFVEAPGFEADDIVAHYTREALAVGFDVLIASTDKDLLQLLDSPGRVDVWDARKRTLIGRTDVREVWGCEPRQIPDLLALMGDKGDNLPGLPGIGPKKAAALLAAHDTVEGVIAAAEAGTLTGPAAVTVGRATAQIRRMLRLATLRDRLDGLPAVVELLREDVMAREYGWVWSKPSAAPGKARRLCGECHRPQRDTPSGATCDRGHGGAPELAPCWVRCDGRGTIRYDNGAITVRYMADTGDDVETTEAVATEPLLAGMAVWRKLAGEETAPVPQRPDLFAAARAAAEAAAPEVGSRDVQVGHSEPRNADDNPKPAINAGNDTVPNGYRVPTEPHGDADAVAASSPAHWARRFTDDDKAQAAQAQARGGGGTHDPQPVRDLGGGWILGDLRGNPLAWDPRQGAWLLVRCRCDNPVSCLIGAECVREAKMATFVGRVEPLDPGTPEVPYGYATVLAAWALEALTGEPQRLCWQVDLIRDLGEPDAVGDPNGYDDGRWTTILERLRRALEAHQEDAGAQTRLAVRVGGVMLDNGRNERRTYAVLMGCPHRVNVARLSHRGAPVGRWALIPDNDPTDGTALPDNYFIDGIPF